LVAKDFSQLAEANGDNTFASGEGLPSSRTVRTIRLPSPMAEEAYCIAQRANPAETSAGGEVSHMNGLRRSHL